MLRQMYIDTVLLFIYGLVEELPGSTADFLMHDVLSTYLMERPNI